MRELQSIAHRRGLDKEWALIAEPWLKSAKNDWKTQPAIVKAVISTEVSTDPPQGPHDPFTQFNGEDMRIMKHMATQMNVSPDVDNDDYFTSHPEAASSNAYDNDEVPEPPTPHEQPRTPRTLQDMVTPLPSEDDHVPWQYLKYTRESAVWQGAAQRRRAHPRRSNKSLGTCCVDLSGPHIPTPMPGQHYRKQQARYFLALTVRPDFTAATYEVSTQTSTRVTGKAPERQCVWTEPRHGGDPEELPPLIYTALLRDKTEASDAIKLIFAQINYDHGNFPTEVVFRIHSDKGTEFLNEDLNTYCANNGIHKTSTAAYDPNANPAENTVGMLKKYARYLLSGARLPTEWWGVSILAAAQILRVQAGLGSYPKIPFGTRAMIVVSPAPKDAFAL